MLRYRYITIEGNIGAGKTSLSSMLARDYNGKLILEQFADNPFLPKFYENPRQHAFALELFFLAERYQQLNDKASVIDLFSSCIISDYLFAKSYLFASINLNEEELKLYKRLSGIMQSGLPEPELLVYLHTPVPQLLQNIEKRNRTYEKNISADYLQRIQDSYFDFFKTQTQLRIAVIDTSHIDFVNHKIDYAAVVNIINNEHELGMKVWEL